MLLLALVSFLATSSLLCDATTPDRASQDVTADSEQLEMLSNYLTRLLVDGWSEGDAPLLYVEGDAPVDNNDVWKRSRYYRRYPWKRQNGQYVSDDRYMCNPTREDVFQLLVALHEARRGDVGRTVSFCNRRRPASAIFTNIRFLGRK